MAQNQVSKIVLGLIGIVVGVSLVGTVAASVTTAQSNLSGANAALIAVVTIVFIAAVILLATKVME